MARFQGTPGFQHQSIQKTGVLLTNLGKPDAPTPKALRAYLREFLWDPRVVEIPRAIWWLILNGVVLVTRPKKSAEAYRSIWRDTGSPLLIHSLAQRDALRARMGDVVVELGMRYGNPSIGSALQSLKQQGVTRLLVLPLYPQYSGSTQGSTFDAMSQVLQHWRWVPNVRFVSQYHDHQAYITALAAHLRAHWDKHGRNPLLLLSYHGLPKHFLDQGDPYFCQCHATSRLLANELGLAEDEYRTTFQSRFGKAEWLKPYTDATMRTLPGEGINRIDIFCPGFSADCLETLEEIAEENRAYFMEAGGEQFNYIPALNAEAVHIDALETMIREQLSGWSASEEDVMARAERAKALGAGG